MADPFAQAVRSRFSGYDDISDDELLSRFAAAAKTDPAKFSSAMRTAFSGYDDIPDAEVAQRFLSKYAPAPTPTVPRPQAPEQPKTVFDAMRQTAAGQMPVAQPAPTPTPQRGFSGGLPDEAYSIARGATATASGATLPQSFVDASNKRLEAEKPRPAGLYAGEEQGLPGKAWDFIKDLSGAGPAAQTAKAQIQLEAQKAGLTPSKYADKVYPAGAGQREMQSLIPRMAQGALSTPEGMANAAAAVSGSQAMKTLADKLSIAGAELEPMSDKFTGQLASGVGSMATFWLPGIGIARGASKLAILSEKAAEWFAIGSNASMEAATEAGAVWRQVLDETGDKAKADKAALLSFSANIALIGATDKLGGLFSKTKGGKAIATTAALEGTQEAGQQIIQDTVQGKPIDWKATGESAAVGAVVGGAVKGFGERALGALASDPALKDYFYQKSAKAEAIRKDAEAALQTRAEVEQAVEEGKEEKRAETAAYAEDEARKRAAEAAGLEVGPEGQVAEKGTGHKELPVEAAKELERPVEVNKTMEPEAKPAPVAKGKSRREELLAVPKISSTIPLNMVASEKLKMSDEETGKILKDILENPPTKIPPHKVSLQTLPEGELNIAPRPTKIKVQSNPVMALTSATSKEQTRYVLNHVKGDPQDGGFYATDGRQLTFIPSKNAEDAFYSPETGSKVDVKENFPNVKQVIPEDKTLKFREGVDAKELLDSVAGVQRANQMTVDKGGIMSVLEHGGEKYVFNPTMLEKSISALVSSGAKKLNIGFGDTKRAIKIKADNGAFAVVMPLNLEKVNHYKTLLKEATNGLQKQGKDKGQKTEIRGSFLGAGEAAEAIANTASKITAAVSENLTGSKLPENLTVMTPKGTTLRDTGLLTKALWLIRNLVSKRMVAKIAPGFGFYYNAGERAVNQQAEWSQRQERLTRWITRPMDMAENTDKHYEDFNKAVFMADMAQQTYTFDELREMGVSAPAASAYVRRARVYHALWQRAVQHQAERVPEGELRDKFIADMKAKEIRGYVNHEFEKWGVYEVTGQNEKGEDILALKGSFNTVREAGRNMNQGGDKILDYSKDKQYVIRPFQMKLSQDFKTGTTDIKYWLGIKDLMSRYKITKEQAMEMSALKPYNRRRFFKNMMKRTGAEGYRKDDAMELFNIYAARMGRYFAMDDFKTAIVNRFQRQYGHDYRTADNITRDNPRRAEAIFTANHIKGVLGEMNDKSEEWLNSATAYASEVLNKITGGLVDVRTEDERPALALIHKATKINSVAKLSGFRAGAVNMIQMLNYVAKCGMGSYMYGLAATMNLGTKEATDFITGVTTGGRGVAFNEELYRETKALLRRAGIAGLSQNVSFSQEASYDVKKPSGVLNNAAFALMFPFRMGERINRITVLAAAYAQARQAGADTKSATAYAIETNNQVNFDYTVANSPAMFSSAIGRLLFQFKSYGVFQAELLLSDMNNKQRARFALGILMIAGAAGEPFWDDGCMLASMILSKIKGKEVDVEAEAMSLLSEWAGDDKAKQAFAKVAFGGIFATMGIDVTRSVSISFLPYGSPASNASVLYGALGGSVASAITELGKGGPGAGHRAFKKLSPPLAAFVDGVDMYKKGSFVAKGGGQVGVSKNEALFKTEGFKLWKERVAEIENTRNRIALENKRQKSLDVNATLADLLAKYISENDNAKADAILADFTKKVSENPEAVNEDSILTYLEKIILPREAVVLERAKTGIKSEEDIKEFLKQTDLKNLY
jgi:hypothetical protein